MSQHIAARCAVLLRQAEAAGGPVAQPPGHAQQQPVGGQPAAGGAASGAAAAEAPTALQLAQLLAHLLLVVDFHVLPDVMEAAEGAALAAVHAPLRQQVLMRRELITAHCDCQVRVVQAANSCIVCRICAHHLLTLIGRRIACADVRRDVRCAGRQR